jgi:hypothetical protein
MRKVNLEVLKPWIATRITELLGGVEDEVLIGVGPLAASRLAPQGGGSRTQLRQRDARRRRRGGSSPSPPRVQQPAERSDRNPGC